VIPDELVPEIPVPELIVPRLVVGELGPEVAAEGTVLGTVWTDASTEGVSELVVPTVDDSCEVRPYETVAMVNGADVVVSGITDHVRVSERVEEGK